MYEFPENRDIIDKYELDEMKEYSPPSPRGSMKQKGGGSSYYSKEVIHDLLADLEIDAQGFELEWYDSFSGGTMLAMDTLLEDNASYYATLYDATSGCESLMRLEVVPTVIPCEVIIFNAISLNDNGLNDYMVIENAEYFPFNTLEIFNRDGHLIYSQKKYGVGDNLFRGIANVDGIYSKGSNLPTGSYLYVFTYYNPYLQEYYTKKGFLTINSN